MPILPLILFLFILIPLVEIYLLIEVGSVIGALPTILAVVFTAVLGVFLIRVQGFSTMHKAQMTLQSGQVPAIEMVEGLMLLLAAVMLLIPGFVTDAFGFFLLIPPIRSYLAVKVITGGLGSSKAGHFSHGEYYEGEYEDLTPDQQHEVNQRRIRHSVIIEGEVEKDKK